MRRYLPVLLVVSLLVSGCLPSFEKQEEVIQDPQQEDTERAIVPRYKISDDFYQTILPFKPGETRGQTVPRLSSRMDVDEFELGLMRISQGTFPSAQYLYQEGQYISRSTISSWLRRELTPAQMEEQGDEANLGLNPPWIEGKNDQETNENSPIILAHVLEQNYLVRKDDGKVELGGISIGLALNSVHEYTINHEGIPLARTYDIPDAVLEEEGKRMADEIVSRIRNIQGLEQIPIVVGLYKQSEHNSIVPGTFITKSTVDRGNSSTARWEAVNEEYHLFPSSDAMEFYRDDAMRFQNFKTDVDEFFPNHTGIVGYGHYMDGDIQKFEINVFMEFYGKAELIGFTQYVTGLLLEHFPPHVNLELTVESINGAEALIVRDAGAEEPFVHIY